MEKFLYNFGSSITIRILISAIFFAFIIRIILCYFKARAHHNGETAETTEEVKLAKKISIKSYFLQSLFNRGGSYKIDDDWLPFIIGFIELIFIPLLIKYFLIKEIGLWLAFKAIVNWSTKNSRTAYNRFLLGNILMLIFSYLIWKYCIGVIIST